ncbi:hypothetical protein D3C72_1188130 [compost metagenome]
MYLGEDLHLRATALVPWFEQETADAGLHAVVAVDLERGVVLREFLEDFDELVGVGTQVIEVGWLRRSGHHENDALIFVRGQFRFGELEEHRDQAQHDHCEHQHHRTRVQRAVEHALIAALEAVKNAVEAVREAAGIFLVA